MKRVLSMVVAILVLAPGSGVCLGRTMPNGRYFGQTPPGFTPVVFAPGIISLPNRFEYCLIFSPNLDECVFGLTNSGWSGFNLLYTRMSSDSTWIDPITAPFQGNGDGTYPTFSMDGQRVCFVSSRPSYPPVRIWSAQRQGSSWSTPAALDPPIFSGYDEWGSSFTNDGTLSFCSNRPGGLGGGDIYRAVTSPEGVVTVENLGAPVNSPQLEGAPRIAPDGSYLIFESRRPGGYGLSDLYVSFNQGGAWTTPRNLGPSINTNENEDGPFVSPDGKYLFFNRRRSNYTTVQTEIWWVDARAVFDPGQSDVGDADPRINGASFLRIEPNPFVSSATLRYATPVAGVVSIKVYDVLGREMQSLVDAPRAAGIHSEALSLPRSAGGVCFLRLTVGDRTLDTVKGLSLK